MILKWCCIKWRRIWMDFCSVLCSSGRPAYAVGGAQQHWLHQDEHNHRLRSHECGGAWWTVNVANMYVSVKMNVQIFKWPTESRTTHTALTVKPDIFFLTFNKFIKETVKTNLDEGKQHQRYVWLKKKNCFICYLIICYIQKKNKESIGTGCNKLRNASTCASGLEIWLASKQLWTKRTDPHRRLSRLHHWTCLFGPQVDSRACKAGSTLGAYSTSSDHWEATTT